jgi:hypothetical protein
MVGTGSPVTIAGGLAATFSNRRNEGVAGECGRGERAKQQPRPRRTAPLTGVDFGNGTSTGAKAHLRRKEFPRIRQL